MATVLSTKKLAVNQKELLLNSGIGLVEYNAISIEFSDFEIKDTVIANAIFTSKNAVLAIKKKNLSIENSFCVGDKTAALATESGFKVVETANNAEELAMQIIEKHNQKEFQFFSGNKRRDELPGLLKKNDIKFTETQVYKTSLNYKQFNSEFDGILFFSPSGVKSFIEKNKLYTTAFCIGNTTAEEAGKYTNNIVTATRPGIENVIAKVVSNLKNK